MKYRAKEFRKGCWMILDSFGGGVVTDDMDGNIQHLILYDEDQARDLARRMTKESEEKEND